MVMLCVCDDIIVVVCVELLNIGALVECIRCSTSSQTQRQALLVVTAIAPHFPVTITIEIIIRYFDLSNTSSFVRLHLR